MVFLVGGEGVGVGLGWVAVVLSTGMEGRAPLSSSLLVPSLACSQGSV